MDSIVRDLDKPFADVYKALDLKAQRKAMRGALRKEAKRVKQSAISNLRNSGIGTGKYAPLQDGIQSRVYPEKFRGLGFAMTVKPRRRNDDGVMHYNRYGKEKPVLMWAEDGTKYRTGRKKRGSRNTGRMPKYGFMHKTEESEYPSVETNLFDNFQRNIEKAARKQGLL